MRGQPVFVLSGLLQDLEKSLRAAAGAGPWQVSEEGGWGRGGVEGEGEGVWTRVVKHGRHQSRHVGMIICSEPESVCV